MFTKSDYLPLVTCETLRKYLTTAVSGTVDGLGAMAEAVNGASSKMYAKLGMIVFLDTQMLVLQGTYVKSEEAQIVVENMSPCEIAQVVTCGELNTHKNIGAKRRSKARQRNCRHGCDAPKCRRSLNTDHKN